MLPKKPSETTLKPHVNCLNLQLLDRGKRRRLTLRELASKAGISYDTARAVEAGNLQTGLGAYLAMLWAMGLESEI